MARELRTSDELRALLNTGLAKHPDGVDAQVMAILETKPDAGGCNWTIVQWTEGRAGHTAVGRALQALVAAARARFNVGAPERQDGR